MQKTTSTSPSGVRYMARLLVPWTRSPRPPQLSTYPGHVAGLPSFGESFVLPPLRSLYFFALLEDADFSCLFFARGLVGADFTAFTRQFELSAGIWPRQSQRRKKKNLPTSGRSEEGARGLVVEKKPCSPLLAFQTIRLKRLVNSLFFTSDGRL